MSRIIRFPLKMKNGADVKTLEQLKDNFDLESVLGYFADGKLKKWLENQYYYDKADAIAALPQDNPNLSSMICDILEVENTPQEEDVDFEYVQRRNEKQRIISAFTDNKEILNNIDLVAISQEDLLCVLDNDPNTVYLYGDSFSIPFKKNVKYIGLNQPIVSISKQKYVFEYLENGISFENVRFAEGINPLITRGELLYLDNQFSEAYPLVFEEADGGNPLAMCILFMMYENGEGTKISEEECLVWVKKAYGMGEPLSTINYAEHCCKNEESKRILSSIIPSLKKLALSGDALAEYIYGCVLLVHGKTDLEKTDGFSLIMKLARKCFLPAITCIGHCFYYGVGVNQECETGFKWYKQAAEKGDINAQADLGQCYLDGAGVEKDIGNAILWYDKAAKQGHMEAQIQYWSVLGVCYYYGVHGVDQDDNKAFELLMKSAELEDTYSQYLIGIMYEYGKGVKKNYEKAIKWLEKSANQDEEDAQDELGKMYEMGYGVPINIKKAVELYQKAANQGNAHAQNNLGCFYVHGNGVEKSYTVAFELFKKAADQGYAGAQSNLAYMYENGYGVHKNTERAIDLYRKAAKQGWQFAINRLKELERRVS